MNVQKQAFDVRRLLLQRFDALGRSESIDAAV